MFLYRINRDIQRLSSDVTSINQKVDALADRVDMILDAISSHHTSIRPVVPAKPGLPEVVTLHIQISSVCTCVRPCVCVTYL